MDTAQPQPPPQKPLRQQKEDGGDGEVPLSAPLLAQGDEVVISGIAGRFAECDNVQQLRDSLLRGADLLTSDNRRWNIDHPDFPPRNGKINGMDKFDANFFGVCMQQAHCMDPMCRMMLEHSCEAIIDAGVNPRSLSGSRMGVYIGVCFSESEKTWFYNKIQIPVHGVIGCSRAMLANQISYWLNVKGPSHAVDSACSSSLYALQKAYEDIRMGRIDCALVGGSNLTLHPFLTLQFMRLGVLSPQGVCRPFDDDEKGRN